MITNLKDTINANRLEIGDKAFYLWKAHNAGVNITDTLIISNKEFTNFRSTLNLDQEMVEQVQAFVSKYFPEKCDRVDILSSLAYPCAGICGYIEIERSAPKIKWAIEKIQRSYWDDKTVAWSAKFYEDQKRIVLNTDVVINEFSGTIVNGTQGIVFFNCDDNYNYSCNMHLSRNLFLITDLLFKHLDPNSFSKLSLKEQNYLVALLARLRRINIEYRLKIDDLKLF